ncbi:MAG: phosphoglucosamine mutase, partial [Anaerolineae bacterium]
MNEVRFSADGIRGIAGYWPFDEQGPAIIGRALGQYVGEFSPHPNAVLGRDTRASGRRIANGLMAGLQATGVHVTDLGVITTPGVAYLARRQQADLGISVSASHNPPQYNGIKLVDRYGLRLQREDEMEIEALIERAARTEAYSLRMSGQRTDGSHLWELYIQEHAPYDRAASLAGFRVVLDCAHGATSTIAPEVFRRLGAEVVAVNAGPNGDNINLRAGSEHVRRHPEDLIRSVQAHAAAYGFAFDGDGDRLIVVDARGYLYTGDDLLFALATHLHARRQLRHATVVTTQTMNRGLDAALGESGIRVIRAGKGDKAVEAAMWSGGYTLGGEQVGNIVINDGRHTAADAVYTAAMLADILHEQKVSLGQMVARYRKWPQV